MTPLAKIDAALIKTQQLKTEEPSQNPGDEVAGVEWLCASSKRLLLGRLLHGCGRGYGMGNGKLGPGGFE